MNKKAFEKGLCSFFILSLVLAALAIPGLNAGAQEPYFPPQLWVVNLPTGEFHVQSWPAGRTVTASIDDPLTDQNPDHIVIRETTSTDCGDRPACAYFSLPEGVNLAPFWTITVSDAEGLAITFKLAEVTFIVDLQNDTVSGTVNPPIPASRLSVLVMSPDDCELQGNYVTVDPQGNWKADFYPYCDIVQGSWGALNVHSETDDAILIGSWGTPKPAYTLQGFYQPVDMNGIYNVVRNGSAVPFKFKVFEGSTELTDPAVIQSIDYTQIACDANASTDNIEITTANGTNPRYDPSDGQFIFNWQTPKTAGVCYKLTMTTTDGSSLEAYFKLK